MGISLIPDLVWGNIDKEFSILMYEPGEVRDSVLATDGSKLSLQVKAISDFPLSGNVIYNINPSSNKNFAINFRIPTWSTNYAITINGVKQNITGSQLIKIERLWKANDKVIVNFEMPLQVLKGGSSYPGFIAFKRGPQVLAMDSVFNPGYENTMPLPIDKDTKFTIQSANNILPKGWVGKQAYSITSDADKKQKPLILVPFADAGQQETRQQVWLLTNEK
jgi:DUF1680 family protein